MSSDADDFKTLMDGVLAGDPVAAETLCRDYQKTILRIVRSKLPLRLRTRYDSLDFVNDVWASFFADLPRHARLSDPDAFAAYLLAMARNKVAEAQRASAVGKRNLAQEKPLETITAGREDLLPGPHPTPSQIVGAEDEFQRMLRNRSDVQQRILTLLRDGGMTYREIADQLNTNEKTVRRLVRRLDPEAKEPCPPS